MAIVGTTYVHKKYPEVRVKVTEIKANGAVWGRYVGYWQQFATTGDIFEKMYVPLS